MLKSPKQCMKAGVLQAEDKRNSLDPGTLRQCARFDPLFLAFSYQTCVVVALSGHAGGMPRDARTELGPLLVREVAGLTSLRSASTAVCNDSKTFSLTAS